MDPRTREAECEDVIPLSFPLLLTLELRLSGPPRVGFLGREIFTRVQADECSSSQDLVCRVRVRGRGWWVIVCP